MSTVSRGVKFLVLALSCVCLGLALFRHYIYLFEDAGSASIAPVQAPTWNDRSLTVREDVRSIKLDVPTALEKYYSELFPLITSAAYASEKCTMVMQTYKRLGTLRELVTHYCKADFLEKILIVWNDVGTPVPRNLLDLKDSCPKLTYLMEKENLMTNRFRPRPEITTKCVVIVDDDRKVEDLKDLEQAFFAWQEFPHRLVGFECRTYTLTPKGLFHYGVYNQNSKYPGNSMMLPATCFMHRVYQAIYHDPDVFPKELFDYINECMNCDDIALNFMVARFLADINMPQPCIITVGHKGRILNLEGSRGGYRGLSGRSNHYTARSECLNKFVSQFYGGVMPLRYSHFVLS